MSVRRRGPLIVVAISAAALALGLAGPSASAQQQSAHPRGSSTYLIDPVGPAADDVFPEGVAATHHSFYVGSTTDGTIYRGRLSGDRATPFLLGGQDDRTSVTGLKVARGKLFVAGAGTGRFFIYGGLPCRPHLVGSFLVDPAPSQTQPSFINDEAVAPNGSVYVTDSMRPVLYRVTRGDYATHGVETLPVWLDFTGTPLVYVSGQFNVNGIVSARHGRYLIVAQSNTGSLFRIRVHDQQVTKIDLGGELVSGDGLVLLGRTLYAVERQGDVGFIVKIKLRHRLTSGRVVERVTDPTFDDPTTAAFARGRLLVVNSQFGERQAGETPDPFTVSSVRLP